MESGKTARDAIGQGLELDEQSLRVVTSEADIAVVTSVEDAGRVEQILLGDDVPTPAAEPGKALRRYAEIGFGLAVTDFLCLLVAVFFARLISFGGIDLPAVYTLAPLLAGLLWAPIFYGFGLYSIQHLAPSEEFRRIIGACSVGVLLMVLLSYWSESELSRVFVAITWASVLLLELTARRAWRFAIGRMRARGQLTLRTLIVGTNEEAHRLGGVLARRGLGFGPVGYVLTSADGPSLNQLPVVGSLEALVQLIRDHSADCVFVASSAVTSDDMLKVMQASRQAGVEVRVSANLSQILATRLSVQTVSSDLMAISLKPVRLTGTQRTLKRLFDVLLASAVIILASPVMLIAALAVRLSSRGPILFRQQRVTKGGRAFTVYKFRTMARDAELLLENTGPDRATAFFKLQDDPRLTGVGRWLRKSSIDELPQLFNVLRGDMSVVGPRPLPIEQVKANPELLTPRLEMFAGVTGWWQVNGRSNLTAEDAVRLDLFYIENWSLSLDLFIVLKTVGVLLARRGAY